MNLVQKRSIIWRLHDISHNVLQCVHSSGVDNGLYLLGNLGIDTKTETFTEIVDFAQVDGDFVDIGAFFNVVSESVLRVKNRNLLFWNTVMTVSGASIAWIDFRRKFSRWLSANGMSIGHSKTVLSFVQSNVDRTNSGVVRKETFLKFAEDLMGIECLLSPEGLVAVDSIPALKSNQPRTAGSDRPRQKPASTPPPPPITHEPVKSFLAFAEPLSPIVVERIDETSTSSHQITRKTSNAMQSIRFKLAIAAIHKAFVARTRTLFALYRIDSMGSRTDEVRLIRTERVATDSRARFLGLCVKSLLEKLKLRSFMCLHTLRMSPEVYASIDEDVTEDAAGPSWTVTIQAVAVSNLFGILRTSLSRALMPAFFSIKGGRSVDEYCPTKKVSWAQSKQGKKDSQAALQNYSHGVLMPINENIPYERIEFDLSS